MEDEEIPRRLAEILKEANLESLESIKTKAICLTDGLPCTEHSLAIPFVSREVIS